MRARVFSAQLQPAPHLVYAPCRPPSFVCVWVKKVMRHAGSWASVCVSFATWRRCCRKSCVGQQLCGTHAGLSLHACAGSEHPALRCMLPVIILKLHLSSIYRHILAQPCAVVGLRCCATVPGPCLNAAVPAVPNAFLPVTSACYQNSSGPSSQVMTGTNCSLTCAFGYQGTPSVLCATGNWTTSGNCSE